MPGTQPVFLSCGRALSTHRSRSQTCAVSLKLLTLMIEAICRNGKSASTATRQTSGSTFASPPVASNVLLQEYTLVSPCNAVTK